MDSVGVDMAKRIGSLHQSPATRLLVSPVRSRPIMRPMPMRRFAFTLIELLIVISIIAVLAGLLIPAVSMIQSKAKDLKCSNNTRQVAIALMVYADDNKEDFPAQLHDMFSSSTYGLRGLERLLVCPKDSSKGASNDMGRAYFHSNPTEDLRYLWESGSSYLYEVSGAICKGGPNTPFEYFYKYSPATDKPPDNTVSWYTAKRNQLHFGWNGDPMPDSLFPIIRCFHHQRWGHNMDKVDKVNNVSWNGNVFWSVISWEYNIDKSLTPWIH
jgi:prepilin-type N-terminal cleavage/methylation domain-containing protein